MRKKLACLLLTSVFLLPLAAGAGDLKTKARALNQKAFVFIASLTV